MGIITRTHDKPRTRDNNKNGAVTKPLCFYNYTHVSFNLTLYDL